MTDDYTRSGDAVSREALATATEEWISGVCPEIEAAFRGLDVGHVETQLICDRLGAAVGRFIRTAKIDAPTRPVSDTTTRSG